MIPINNICTHHQPRIRLKYLRPRYRSRGQDHPGRSENRKRAVRHGRTIYVQVPSGPFVEFTREINQ
jgi:hypothetical protein